MDKVKVVEDTFYLEEASIEPDSEDDFQYEEVGADDDFSVSGNEEEEDLDTILRTANDKQMISVSEETKDDPVVVSRTRAEVVEDFVRNFLVRKNMMRTLDCFQTEWYEFKEKGLLMKEDTTNVPDVYARNKQLDELVNALNKEVEKYKDAAHKAKETHLKLRKERDFHRMHHKRVVQEKDKLITDIKRLKQHYESYEPTLKALRHKYEAAMKEKMLTKLERDRAVAQIEGLQSTAQFLAYESVNGKQSEMTSESRGQSSFFEDKQTSPKKHPKDSDFPPDKGVNPLLSKNRIPCPHLTRSGGFRLTNKIHAHQLGISSFALHPKKQILATCSDDKTWKLWSVPDGEEIMAAEGHNDWLSDCDFNPQGTQLVTTSGDTTVKIWDFAKEQCVISFNDHTHPVWGCSWHSAGDFVATCAMDGSSKIFDLNSLRCRNTLRGHTDSVNSIQFLPFSNTLCTCSADKTISLWDARTGLCAQTLYGHQHAINHVTFNLKGDTLASCDAYGVVKLWDVRNTTVSATVDLGPHPVNRVAFDPGSSIVAAASNDGLVRMYEVASGHVTTLDAHDDSVQTVIFDRNGEYMLSGGSDAMFKLWS